MTPMKYLLWGLVVCAALAEAEANDQLPNDQTGFGWWFWLTVAVSLCGVIACLGTLDACCGCGPLGFFGILGQGASYGSGANPVWNNHVETCPPDHPAGQ